MKICLFKDFALSDGSYIFLLNTEDMWFGLIHWVVFILLQVIQEKIHSVFTKIGIFIALSKFGCCAVWTGSFVI